MKEIQIKNEPHIISNSRWDRKTIIYLKQSKCGDAWISHKDFNNLNKK